MKVIRRKKPSDQIRIAEERIKKLFELCEEAVKNNRQDLADRYAEIARKISMKYKVKLPKEFNRRICKKCGSFLTPGINLRVRLNKNIITYTCLNCGSIRRFGRGRDKED